MNQNIQLHANEKILLTLKPKHSASLYLAITNTGAYFLPLMIILFVFTILPANNGHDVSLTTALKQIITLLAANIWWIIPLFIIISLISYFWSKYAVSQYQYTITNQRIINYSGFWGINCKIIPYERIVDVDLKQNPLQRLLGISSVFIGEQNILINANNARQRQRNANNLVGLSPSEAAQALQIISEQISRK